MIEDDLLYKYEGEEVSPEELDKRRAAAQEELKKAGKIAASRLFFVRQPKPAELSPAEELEKEKNGLDDKLRGLNEELQPIMAERSKVSSQLAEAREAARELKAQIDDKELILNPYQQERKAASQDRAAQRKDREEQWAKEKQAREAEQNAKQKIRNDFNSQYGHLGVQSDEQIDAKIRDLEFQQQHESLSIAEEKAVLKQIRQLQDAREPVREFALWSAAENAERKAAKERNDKRKADREQRAGKYQDKDQQVQREAPKDPQEEEMEELRAQLNELWEDYKLQMDIRNRHSEIESGHKKQIETLMAKRDALRLEREKVWQKIVAHKESVRAANKPYADNRSFSSQVRELIKRGKTAEARELCSNQTTEVMGQYADDAEFRKEYNRLWDAAVDYKRPAAVATESHHNAAASVIAKALEEARRHVASKNSRAKEQESKAAESSKPKEKSDEAAPKSVALPEAFQPPKPAAIPGMEVEDKPKSRPKKEKKAVKAAPIDLPVMDETPFVPPAAILERNTAGPSAEEMKDQERAHNRAAAAEAAQRKERRRLAQEKKRQQKLQQRASDRDLQGLKEQPVEDVSVPEALVAEEDDPAALQEFQPTSVAAEDTGKLPGRKPKVNNNNKAPARAAPAPKPRPFARKKSFAGTLRLYGNRIYATFEEHPVVAGVGGAAAVLLAVAPAIYFYS